MKAPRVVATDLDGTLLGADGRVSARTAGALVAAAEVGIDVVFVTARPLRWLDDVAEHVAGHGVAICSNGAAVVEVATLAVLEEHGMDDALVSELARRARDVLGGPGNTQLAVEHAGGITLERHYESEHPTPDGTPFVERLEDLLPGSTLKLLVRTGTPRPDLHALLADAFGPLATVADSGAADLGEISRPDVSKATTLATWLAGRGIAADDVWAFGDAPNDLPMLRWAGRSFAVANARRAVQDAVHEVCPANTDDGVAQVVERAVALASG
ncbi:HAD family hydrolase [Luteimicrobium sp. NPDC057192]|uniref:HAD family hydrolase n=1 Tax=Luteimicrobium sp. NPDC057192 TaxID=3346042 RepID=UPI003641A69C